MSLLQAAQREIGARNAADPIRVTLEYLLANAVGQSNSIPIPDVLMHLSNHGIVMQYNEFQQTVLGASRHSDYFIGSGTRGVFLIDTPADARAMRDFYQNKIQTQQQNLANLVNAVGSVGWQI